MNPANSVGIWFFCGDDNYGVCQPGRLWRFQHQLSVLTSTPGCRGGCFWVWCQSAVCISVPGTSACGSPSRTPTWLDYAAGHSLCCQHALVYKFVFQQTENETSSDHFCPLPRDERSCLICFIYIGNPMCPYLPYIVFISGTS